MKKFKKSFAELACTALVSAGAIGAAVSQESTGNQVPVASYINQDVNNQDTNLAKTAEAYLKKAREVSGRARYEAATRLAARSVQLAKEARNNAAAASNRLCGRRCPSVGRRALRADRCSLRRRSSRRAAFLRQVLQDFRTLLSMCVTVPGRCPEGRGLELHTGPRRVEATRRRHLHFSPNPTTWCDVGHLDQASFRPGTQICLVLPDVTSGSRLLSTFVRHIYPDRERLRFGVGWC